MQLLLPQGAGRPLAPLPARKGAWASHPSTRGTPPPFRASQSQDCALCGRVLLFLSRFFRLTDRSGVNLLGGFNTGNATPVEEVSEVRGAGMSREGAERNRKRPF